MLSTGELVLTILSVLLNAIVLVPALGGSYYLGSRRGAAALDQIEELTNRYLATVDKLSMALETLDTNRSEIRKLRDGIERLLSQLSELGVMPAWTPNGEVTRLDRSFLIWDVYQLLTLYFNLDEMKEVAMKVLGIDPESIRGETPSVYGRELVHYCARHSRLKELVNACRELRPAGLWPIVF